MNKIAKFEKVSFEQFKKDWMKNFPDCTNVKEIYNNIKLPKRATVGSAGYDFYAPADVTIEKGKSTLIPTGIRSKIADGWVLDIFPRSGLGFKHRIQLDNTVGIIDADYYNNTDNEGHIMVALMNMGTEAVKIPQGERIAQGIFYNYLTVDDDDKVAKAVRGGGFGSTGK